MKTKDYVQIGPYAVRGDYLTQRHLFSHLEIMHMVPEALMEAIKQWRIKAEKAANKERPDFEFFYEDLWDDKELLAQVYTRYYANPDQVDRLGAA